MRWIIVAAALIATRIGPALAADSLTLQLNWVHQAQFAGYYVAAARGYYKSAGLDVTIRPGGPEIDQAQSIADGAADVVVDWMPSALAARDRGVKLVNIAQVFQRSGLELTCRRDNDVFAADDLKGKTVGVWFGGHEYPFLAWMNLLGLKTDGTADGVTVMHQGFAVDLLLRKQAACISTMSFNEYLNVVESGLKPDQLTVFKYEDERVATLEDGIYAPEAALNDPAKLDRLVRFLQASMHGWRYAVVDQEEAVRIVLANDIAGVLTQEHQKLMMWEISKLLTPAPHGLGYLDEAAYNRTVQVLLSGKSASVIAHEPQGAWTHAVWDKAFGP
jgi:NitT/TauT family transport system substrate-binding protein